MLRAFAIFWLLCGGLSAADFQACPATIDVKPHQIGKAPAGWSVGYDHDTFANGQNHVLWFVTLYDGEPKERASLVPDVNERLRAEWKFNPEQTVWLECHYTRTTLVLSRALPKGVKSCVVTFEPNVSIDGHNSIKAINCK